MDIKEQLAFLDLLARVYSLEKVLIDKKIISQDDLVKEYSENTEKLYKTFTELVSKNITPNNSVDMLNKIKNN